MLSYCVKIQHFTRQVATYRKTLRCRLTANSRLRVAMDCGHWSKYVDWRRSKFHDLHISVDRHDTGCTCVAAALSASHSSCLALTATHEALLCCCRGWPLVCPRNRSFDKWKAKLSINVDLPPHSGGPQLLFLNITFIVLYWASDSYWSPPTVVSVGKLVCYRHSGATMQRYLWPPQHTEGSDQVNSLTAATVTS